MVFRQLFDRKSCTYTYLLADSKTREAVIIDPVIDHVERDVRLIKELSLDLKYTCETHVHADHITGSGMLRDRLGAQSVASLAAKVPCVDVAVTLGDRLEFGAHALEVRSTPGHTDGCVTYILRTKQEVSAFTGDCLLIRGCGRTDFQQGDAATLYASVHREIFSLPDDAYIFPGHDYHGNTVTTVREEKLHNPRLQTGTSETQFVEIMSQLKLPDPAQMDVALPANLACGSLADAAMQGS